MSRRRNQVNLDAHKPTRRPASAKLPVELQERMAKWAQAAKEAKATSAQERKGQ